MKKIYITLFLLCLIRLGSYGQGFNLLSNSNYSPVNSVYFNPAKIADSKQKLQINVASFNFYAANDYGVFPSIGKAFNAIRNKTKFGDILTFQQNGKNKNMDVNMEVRGLSFVASLGGNQSLALTTRGRVLFSANNVTEKLMDVLVKGLQNTTEFGNIPNAEFDINSNLVGETSLSYSRALFNKSKNVFKIGITGKYLLGAGNAQIYNNKSTIEIKDKPNFVVPELGYTTIVTNGVDINAYYSNAEFLSPNKTNLSLKNILVNAGRGFGADFGFEYEFRPHFADYKYEMDGKTIDDTSVPRYALKFGMALTDVGSITYNSGKQLGLLDNTPNKEWTEQQIKDFDLANLEGSLNNVYPGKVTSGLKYTSKLPTRLNMNLDVKVAKNFYIATNYMRGLSKNPHTTDLSKQPGVIDPTGNFISISPRIEKADFEVALPITYSSRYKKTNIGIGARGGVFFLATDDIAGAVGIGKFTSLNIYGGITLSLGKHKKKDRDGDHISDKMDKCPKIPGPADNDGCPWPDMDKDGVPDKDDSCPNLAGPVATHGCPDSDGDGIADNGDNCPSIPGPKSSQGCPDADGDGIADKDDLCPTQPGSRDAKGCPDRDRDGIADLDDLCPDQAGSVATRGCPDKDNDGVLDKEDKCPEVAGTVALKGCPDKDGDGIADSEDACPDLAGPMMSRGCPDTDKDGILDSEDACPTIAGPLALKGCPDKDGDGIGDSEDTCPEIPGPLSSKGCPDKDGDGVPDNMDKCIDVVGPASNGGCPITQAPTLTKIEEKIIFKAVADLQFETGKSVIKAYSFDSLDELAALMVKRPELTLILSGHTDNVGKPASNKILSLKRAQAVKNYLMDAGVDGSRIAAVGYGSTKPVASNKTPQGRQKNRRVEFKVN